MKQHLESAAQRLGADTDASQFVRFLIVGVINTVFGVAVYAALVWSGVPPQPALAIAFVIGVAWNFFTHARYVFSHKGLSKIVPYFGAYLAIYLINRVSLGLLLSAGVHPIWAQVICAPFIAMISFLAIGRVLTGRIPLFSRK